MSLPVFFIILTSATLLAALTALFASLRATFGGTSLEPLALGLGLPDRAALEDEKNALLRALKDLEYEHEVGKIADDDYQRLDRAYRMRAKQVLADLDRDLGPYLSQAEALASRALDETKAVPAESARGGKRSKKKGKAGHAEATREEAAEHDLPDEPATETRPSEPSSTEPSSTEPSSTEPSSTEPPSEAPPSETPASEAADAPAPLVCAKCTTKNDLDASFCKRCASPLGTVDPEASV